MGKANGESKGKVTNGESKGKETKETPSMALSNHFVGLLKISVHSFNECAPQLQTKPHEETE